MYDVVDTVFQSVVIVLALQKHILCYDFCITET